MAKKQTADDIIRAAQKREDKHRAFRLGRIKRAVAGADFLDIEISQIEQVVFAAYGRTKLR